LKQALPSIRSLRDVSLCDFEKHQGLLDPILLKRCRHIVSENQRVLDTVEALRNGNAARVKVLFRESHESLRDDYEVSCPELDMLVELAQRDTRQGGSRMTGGGFGGCTVHLVPDEKQAVESFVSSVSEGYRKAFGMTPDHYLFTPAAGAKAVNEAMK
jgi:galactokinase